jgi:exodeoxyribonuclease VII small subunit
MKDQPANEQRSFEASLARLEEIVSEMEQGKLALDAMLKRFEEGFRLAQFCSRKLDESEKKIEVLVKNEDGTFGTREFQPSRGDASDRGLSEDDTGQAAEREEEEGEPLF